MSRPRLHTTPRRQSRVRALLVRVGVCALAVAVSAASTSAAEVRTGEEIYQQLCASCHGAQGEGVADQYGKPLIGDRSVAELARIISDTMPEGEPEQCAGPEAQQVAQYIYDAFYSEIAQTRNKPATVALSRLTVRQYEQSAADLLRSFRGWGEWRDERGLKAEYFNSRNTRRDKRVIERVDAVVDFDFGDGSPHEDIGKEEFSATWDGSLYAAETGVYEFIVETENGARLWVNSSRDSPVVDAWVRSGPETQFRGSVRLLGGRVYPLRLEFFKFKEPRASIRLKWKPPHQTEELLPERCLTPTGSSATFVLTTPFPPDDRSTGVERGTSVSPEWHEATTFAAIETAAYVAARLRDLIEVRRDDGDRAKKVREFCFQFAERAFRRPLTAEERRLYVDVPFDSAPNEEAAIKRIVLLVLKSPRFLYREAGLGEFDDYAVASWLSYGLWDSLPDKPLLDAAARGELRTQDQLQRQAERMLRDPRSQAKMREFLHHWLKLDHAGDIAKNTAAFPEFDPTLTSDLRTSLYLFLDDVLWNGSADFRTLLTSDKLYMSRRMAEFYGAPRGDGAGFEAVVFEPDRRAGLLSHPYLLAAFAYDQESSPIHRGVWLSRNVLGRMLSPPPVAVAPIPPDLHAGLTTRERVTLQTSPAMCVKCHSMINSLGFSLEQFDAVGRFRESELGKPVDAEGSYLTRDGQEVRFQGARELARFLAESPEVHQAFTDRLFQYMLKQPIRAFGDDYREQLREEFAASGFDVRRLLQRSVVTSALWMHAHSGPRTAAAPAAADRVLVSADTPSEEELTSPPGEARVNDPGQPSRRGRFGRRTPSDE